MIKSGATIYFIIYFVITQIPIINANCKSEAIVKQFYKKLQPESLSQDMLNLEIKDVTEAIQTLHAKLKPRIFNNMKIHVVIKNQLQRIQMIINIRNPLRNVPTVSSAPSLKFPNFIAQ